MPGVGVFQQGMQLTQALQTFTLLTVGDGLVSEIPALLVSTEAGNTPAVRQRVLRAAESDTIHTHTFDMEQAAEAFEMASSKSGGAIKVLLKP